MEDERKSDPAPSEKGEGAEPSQDAGREAPPSRDPVPEKLPQGEIHLGEGKAIGVKPIMFVPVDPGMPDVPEAPGPVNVAPSEGGGEGGAPSGSAPPPDSDSGSTPSE